MSKHNKEKVAKEGRNELYAMKFKRRVCEDCKHKSSRPGKCVMCTGKMITVR